MTNTSKMLQLSSINLVGGAKNSAAARLVTHIYNKIITPRLYSIFFVVLLEIDMSVLVVAMVLCAMITFFAGIVYGMYLKDRLSKKPNNKQVKYF